MKAKSDSIHAKLYRFTYFNEYGLPKNVCDYFWKLVVAMVFFIPNFLIRLPMNIIYRFDEGKYDGDDYLFSIFIYLLCALLGCFVYKCIWFPQQHLYYWINNSPYDKGYLFWGIVEWVIIIVVIVTILIILIKHSILWQFIKAKYNNYCPKIDWD